MDNQKAKMGRPPKAKHAQRNELRGVRMNKQMAGDLRSASLELNLTVPDLMRIGTYRLLQEIKTDDFDLSALYKDCHTT